MKSRAFAPTLPGSLWFYKKAAVPAELVDGCEKSAPTSGHTDVAGYEPIFVNDAALLKLTNPNGVIVPSQNLAIRRECRGHIPVNGS